MLKTSFPASKRPSHSPDTAPTELRPEFKSRGSGPCRTLRTNLDHPHQGLKEGRVGGDAGVRRNRRREGNEWASRTGKETSWDGPPCASPGPGTPPWCPYGNTTGWRLLFCGHCLYPGPDVERGQPVAMFLFHLTHQPLTVPANEILSCEPGAITILTILTSAVEVPFTLVYFQSSEHSFPTSTKLFGLWRSAEDSESSGTQKILIE